MAKGAGIGTRILWFFLGIIFAFLAVGGAVAAVAFVHFDSLFETFNVKNKDEDGEYIYVNTGAEGVQNVYSLIQKLIGMASNPDNMTIGELENILPVSKGLVDSLVTAVEPYVDMDKETFREELVGTPVKDLGDYISTVVGNVQVYNVLNQFAPDMMGDDAAGKIIKAIALGREADYVTVSADVRTPVYVDVYKEVASGVYQRYLKDGEGNYSVADEKDGTPAVLLPAQATYLEAVYNEEQPDTPVYYNLYYYLYDLAGTGETMAFVTDKNFTFTATVENATAVTYQYAYNQDNAVCTGKYYMENGAPVILTPVRLKDLSSSQSLTDSMDNLKLTDLMPAENLDETTNELLGDYSLGDFISGRVNIQEVVDTCEFTLFMQCKPDNTVMVALLYEGVSNMKNEGGVWTCDYTDIEGNTHSANVVLADDGNIDKIIYGAGGENQVPETLVNAVPDKVTTLEVSALLDSVSPTDGLMAYLCYGVTDLEFVSTNVWTAQYEISDGVYKTCTVKTKGAGADEYITRAYYTEGTEEISVATTVNGIDEHIAKMTKVLKIKEIVEIDPDDKFMSKLGDYTIETVGSAVNDFEVADMIDVTPTDSMMVYIGYGVKNVQAVSGQSYQYTAQYTDYSVTPNLTYDVYVKTAWVDDGNGGTKEVVEKAYYMNADNEVLIGTKVNQVADRMNNFSNDLTLVDILGKEALEGNKTLNALKKSTLNHLAEDIKNLSMQSLYFADIYGVATDADPKLATTFNVNFLYYKKEGDGAFVLVHDEKEIHQRGKLTEEEFNAEPKVEYYTYGELEGTWKYMLTCTDGLVTGEEVCTVNDIADLSSNVLQNVKNATLRDLNSTGVVEITPETLDSTLIFEVNGKNIMGDLTVDETIKYVETLTAAYNTLPRS